VLVTTLIYDGDCGFCSTCVRWLQKRVATHVNMLPFQWIDVTSFGLTEEDAASQVWFVTAAGLKLGGADAVSAVLQLCRGRVWQLLGSFMGWPVVRPFASVGYRLVAKYRHKLPGGTPACKMDTRDRS
jgi:predicted DCC family thiol-disulfide oxidoreductase YuxK